MPVEPHQLDEQTRNGRLLQAVHAPLAVRGGQNEAQSREEVVAGLATPSRDEAFDDATAVFVGRGLDIGAASPSSRRLFPGGAQGVEKTSIQFGEEKGLAMILRPVWVSKSMLDLGGRD